MQQKNSDPLPTDVMRVLTQGTAAAIGEDFFRSLARHAAQALNARYAFVAESLSVLESRSLAYWEGADFGGNFSYRLPGTPCQRVTDGEVCFTRTGLREAFPEDRWLEEIGADSYLGVPMLTERGQVVGHLAVLHTEAMQVSAQDIAALRFFAARAAVEIERMRAFDTLLRQSRDSEAHFRDLFDEAPIAYVYEGLDSRFIHANRTAMKMLGIQPEDVPTTYGKTFAPDTPSAQRRMREAFEAIGRGTDTSGVVLEMRRRDNGAPLWIQWWSRPDPSGTFTRTMFVDITERMLAEQENARLSAQNTYLQEEIRSEHNFEEIVGSHPALMDLLGRIEQVAETDSTVLITGETGTGKELVARALHSRSRRREQALVKVNCGAISAGLVESELFGHVRGAFTGALTKRIGRFELADRGTLFLDEVGELPMDTQVKLLRVLQEQEFEPVGSNESRRVDVRVIAASNRNLEEAIATGRFRADLFYRLNVIPLRVPPLRERRGDIPQLAAYFLQRNARKCGKSLTGIAADTMRRLMDYPWPGNIRELHNLIERGVVLSSGFELSLDPAVLPAVAKAPSTSPSTAPFTAHAGGSTAEPPASIEDMERQHIRTVLERTQWIVEGSEGAACILKINPSTLRSRMKKLGLRRATSA